MIFSSGEVCLAGFAVTDFVTTPLFPSEFWVCSFFPHPTNATTAIIKRICFMPATLRLTGSGVNAVGAWDSSIR
jgi:hypothetical protein